MDEKENFIWFVKYPSHEKDFELLKQINLLVDERELSVIKSPIVEIQLAAYARELKNGSISSASKLRLFFWCTKNKIYPPLLLLEQISDIFAKFIDSRSEKKENRPSLDELFKVDKNRLFEREKRKERDQGIAFDVLTMMNLYKLKLSPAVAMVLAKGKEADCYKNNTDLSQLDFPTDTKQIENIFHQYKTIFNIDDLSGRNIDLEENYFKTFPLYELKKHLEKFPCNIQQLIVEWGKENPQD